MDGFIFALFLAVLAIVFLVSLRADAIQAPGVLRIKVVVVNGQQQATPVPRHVLLISDNPSSAPPRRILTSSDGSVEVRLPPGNYTVESDRPLAFEGREFASHEVPERRAGNVDVAAVAINKIHRHIESVVGVALIAHAPFEGEGQHAGAALVGIEPDFAAHRLKTVGLSLSER